MTETIPLQGASMKVHLIIVTLVVGLPFLVTLLASSQIKGSLHFVLGVTLAVTLSIVGFIIYAISYPSVVIADGKFTVKAGMYSHSVDFDDIDTDRVRRVELEEEPLLRLGVRSNGIGLFTYNLGYFTLANGENAFVVLSGSSAVLVPTDTGMTFLLSTQHASELIESVK